ncbi:MAG: sulfotransferase family 2 domain-containing protein [Pseudomonadota bacterium]
MISEKYNCIFVHIPKTGGSSIENMIWDWEERTAGILWGGFITEYFNKYQAGGLQHLLATQIRHEIGEDRYSRAFTFSMVRNPFDRIVSQFFYMSKREDLRTYISMQADDCFQRYLDLITKRKHVQWERQHRFVHDHHGNCLVDRVMRFEDFDREVSKLMEALKIPFTHIRHDNQSTQNKQGIYDKASYEQVADMFREDFELLDYAIVPFEHSRYACEACISQ